MQHIGLWKGCEYSMRAVFKIIISRVISKSNYIAPIHLNDRIVKSIRKTHTQDATKTKTPTIIIQNTHTHTRTRAHTHTRTHTHTHDHTTTHTRAYKLYLTHTINAVKYQKNGDTSINVRVTRRVPPWNSQQQN